MAGSERPLSTAPGAAGDDGCFGLIWEAIMAPKANGFAMADGSVVAESSNR